MYVAFSVACFSSAAFLVTAAFYHTSASVPEAGLWLRWQMALALPYFPALFAFVALLTQQPNYKPWLFGITAFCTLLLVVNLARPYGLRFSSLTAMPNLRLPWGEQVAFFHGGFSLWNAILRAASLALMVWAAARTLSLFRGGLRRSALLLALSLLLQIFSSLWGTLVDLGLIQSIYLTGFAFFAMVLFMSVSLGLDLRDRNASLEQVTGELQREVDERRRAETQIRHMGSRDDLTQLANRAALQTHLTEVLEHARLSREYGGMLLIDLDHFKTINDALGHEVGDGVLCQVAERLRRSVADAAVPSGFVARLGGDEFVVVVARVASDRAAAERTTRALAQLIADHMKQPLRVGERVFSVGASIGATILPDGNASESDLLRRADMALYAAKNRGRNGVQFYQPTMQSAADQRLALERCIRVAVDRNELVLYFQPQVDAAGRMSGVEALLRWRHSELGELMPEAFVGVAEETGLIHAIGDWVLQESCARLAEWQRSAVPVVGAVSINVSQWQLLHPDFVPRLQALLREYALPPQRLILEITESSLLRSPAEALEKLAALRTLGCKIALDDFGTGYSSLAYLQSMSPDQLKIDKVFVAQITDQVGKLGTPLVASIMALARNLKVQVVAEGVETELQRAELTALGCQAFQGFLFAQPMRATEFAQWCHDNAARANRRADATCEP
jgi:diguanylate cyclase